MKPTGFTLVELILVIILLGILSVVALPRLFDSNTFQNAFARSELSTALTWTRNRAVTSHCAYELRLSNTAWQVFRDANCSSTLVEVACTTGSEPFNFSVPASDGTSSLLTGTTPTSATLQRLIFTAQGQVFLLTTAPVVASCTALPTNPVAANTTITLSTGDLTLDGATAYATLQ